MQTIHDSLSSLFNDAQSKMTNGVSSHTFSNSLTLHNLRDILSAAGDFQKHVFVGTVDGETVVSVNRNAQQPEAPANGSRKRKKCEHETAVQDALTRVKKGADVSDKTSAVALKAAVSLLKTLKGSYGERALESWSFTLNSATDAKAPKLVLTLRISPSVAVPLATLVSAVGSANDGMLSCNPANIKEKYVLPLHEESRTAERFGQRALSFFTML